MALLGLLNQAWESGSILQQDRQHHHAAFISNPPLSGVPWVEDGSGRGCCVCSAASRSIQPCCRSAPLCCASIVLPSSGMLTAALSFFFFSPPPSSTQTHQHTLVCVCTHRSARVSVRLWLQRTGFPSHVDQSDGLLLGFVYHLGLHVGSGPLIRARFDPGLVQPEAWRSWTEQSKRLCSCSAPLERQRWFRRFVVRGGLDPERSGSELLRC